MVDRVPYVSTEPDPQRIDPALRELAVVQTCILCDSPYEMPR